MNKKIYKYFFRASVGFILLLSIACFNTTFAQSDNMNISNLKQQFQHPSTSAKPWVYWYWMKGAVTKAGIKTDLEAMKKEGLAGAYLVPIEAASNPPLVNPPANTFTPQWWKMLRYAFEEANHLGLFFTMHCGDGYATAGGPWITPQLSMQKVTWSEVHVDGNSDFNDTLPHPLSLRNYYKDIAILAFPSPEGTGITTQSVTPIVTTSTGEDASFLIQKHNKKVFKSNNPCWIQYEFTKPFTCRSVITGGATNNYQSHRLLIKTSNDGIHFHTLCRLTPARNGWDDSGFNYTHLVPTVTARYFRFYYNKAGSEPGSEDNEMAKWKSYLKIKTLELSSAAVIDEYEGKNGEVWRFSPATPSSELDSSVCVPFNKIINITDKYHDGKLSWHIPAGQWTIFRVGYTTTGTENMTGGAEMGLECDKFNPVAAKLEFNNWYGTIRKKLGNQLTSEVLKRIHVDSWECGSQNWSPIFKKEFIKRRGYDPTLYLPAMAGIPIKNAKFSEKFLYDIRKTISELYVDNFYGVLDSLAKKNGYEFSGESAAPVMCGDDMLHYKKLDIPMGEFWLNSPTHDKPTDILDAISAGHVYGKPVIQAEAFTTLRMDWNEYPGMLKYIQDRNYSLGINRFVFHVFTLNPWPNRMPGMTLGPTGLLFQPTQTWWKPAQAWVTYTQRCQALLQYGTPVVDIAVFTGEGLPRRAILPERLINTLPGLIGKAAVDREDARLANAGVPMWNKPDGVINSANTSNPADWIDPLRGYKYDSLNPDAFFHLISVKNSDMDMPGGISYKLLVLPRANPMMPDTTLSKRVQKRLSELQHEGVKIIRFYNQRTLNPLGIRRDIIFRDSTNKIVDGFAWTHRRTTTTDIYFISNQQDSLRHVIVSLRITGRVPEFWDPLTGKTSIANQWKIENGRTELPIQLDAYGSIFVILHTPTHSTYANNGLNWNHITNTKNIHGPWKVKFSPKYGGPRKTILFPKLQDWRNQADPAIKYYSGTAIYSINLKWDKNKTSLSHQWLELGKVDDIAKVTVNGVPCGVAWTSPYRVDISKALKNGNNKIEIAVTNTWINRLIGDSLLPAKQRVTYLVNPVYRLDDKTTKEAGLIGPVKLLSEE